MIAKLPLPSKSDHKQLWQLAAPIIIARMQLRWRMDENRKMKYMGFRKIRLTVMKKGNVPVRRYPNAVLMTPTVMQVMESPV